LFESSLDPKSEYYQASISDIDRIDLEITKRRHEGFSVEAMEKQMEKIELNLAEIYDKYAGRLAAISYLNFDEVSMAEEEEQGVHKPALASGTASGLLWKSLRNRQRLSYIHMSRR